MRISHFLSLVAPVLTLTVSWSTPSAVAQEGLAGMGAASAIGAGLAAGAATTLRPGQVTKGINGATNNAIDEAGDPSGRGGNGGVGPTTAAVSSQLPPLASNSGRGGALLQQLIAPPFRPIPDSARRSPRGQAAYSRRVSRLSPTARKKLVLKKYRIGPRGYLAAYLPADRYKFAKAWKYVSTETSPYYYRPQDMARRGFNANRVIGFRTWQDATLAGYRPDPISKPEPGNQLAYIATLTRDEPLLQTIEYAYAGQISPATLDATYNYVRRVKAIIDRNPSTRNYQRQTINTILRAYLVGDPTLIPKQVGYVPPVVTLASAGGPNMPPSVAANPPGVPGR